MEPRMKTIRRKSGAVAILHVEVLAIQKQRLLEDCETYKMTQGEIVEQALQLWHNTVAGTGGK